MDNDNLFARNLRALSERNAGLCSRLSEIEIAHNTYEFRESRNGEVIPALRDADGAARPLHSTMDPRREARRLIDTAENGGFLILPGLGGGYYAEAALERDDICAVLVIEYGLAGFAELMRRVDYTRLFGDPRFHIFVDISNRELEDAVLKLYQPVLSGGIRGIPLRARTALDPAPFAAAGNAVEAAIKRVSADYSVQAHFGKRWFSNIVRNLKPAEAVHDAPPKISRAAITAAGPSLSAQIPLLRKNRNGCFLFATDTSLPCLLHEKIIPDAVISIDCQHISYYHFIHGLPDGVLLFLDLASPPLLSGFSKKPYFFLSAHPLARYISRTWKDIPELDTSGGNVTYAALSLAETLGADSIELYGADFSYPGGVSYARGAYIYPFFEKRQNRFSSLEAQASAFLYRTPLEKKIRHDDSPADSWYYETGTLKFYRERLEEKSGTMEAAVIPVHGFGAPIKAGQGGGNQKHNGKSFSSSHPAMTAFEFLQAYKSGINKLPKAGKNAAGFIASLEDEVRAVFTTLLPTAAAIQQSRRGYGFGELVDETKAYCVKEIDAVLG